MKKILIFVVVLFVLSASSAFGEIQVYDANNAYIGYLVSINKDFEVDIYIPSLSKYIRFVYEPDEPDAGIISDTILSLYFWRGECDGHIYMPAQSFNEERLRYYIFRSCSKLYRFENDTGGMTTIEIYTAKRGDCSCYNIGPVDKTGYRLLEVSLPFSYPIALPLRFEYENGTTH